MDRRGFLQGTIIGAGALAFDVERLLWVSGKKTIFLPPPITKRTIGYTSLNELRAYFDLPPLASDLWIPWTVKQLT